MGATMTKDVRIRKDYLRRCLKKFSSDELEVLRKIYKDLEDRSSSLGIDKETFLQYFNLPGLWGERLFRKFDVNDSKSVELDEFLTGIAICCRGTRAEKMHVLFQVFDLNNDGLIQKYELVAMLSNFPILTKHLSRSIWNGDFMGANDEHFAGFSEPLHSLNFFKPLRGNYGTSSNHKSSTVDPCNVVNRVGIGCKSKMRVRKMAHRDSINLGELASSLSKFSFQSGTSNDSFARQYEPTFRYNADACSYLNYDCNYSRDRINCTGRKVALKRSFSATACAYESKSNLRSCTARSNIKCAKNICDSPLDRNENGNFVDKNYPATHDGGCGYYTSVPDNAYVVDKPGQSPSNLEYDQIYSGTQTSDCLTLENGTLGSLKLSMGRFRKEHNFNQPLSGVSRSVPRQKYMYGACSRSNLEVPCSIAAKSVIENGEQEFIDGSNLNLDILVEQILEGCEFNENGCLSFLKFKAWLDKNDSILTMFSECLHEEVWGLQGNAFYREQDHGYLQSSKVSSPIPSSDCYDSSKLVSMDDDLFVGEPEVINEINKRMVYRLFLVKGSDALTFKNYLHGFDRLASEEMSERMRAIKPKLSSHLTNGKLKITHRESGGCDDISYEMFACPNCMTPFLMCPVCCKRYHTLSLHVENDVYIECKSCTKNCKGVFKSCWICGWEFTESMRCLSNCGRRKASVGASDSNDPSARSEHLIDIERTEIPENIVSASISSTNNGKMDILPFTLCGGLQKSKQASLPTKTGVMYKIGKRLHQWKARYYVLAANVLYYYTDRSSTRPKGCIFLEGCYLDALEKQEFNGKFGFQICHRGKKFSNREFYVNSKEQFFEWMDALSSAMRQHDLTQMYEICEQLGQGKFSIVYRAILKETGEEYAVKVIDKTRISSQERELLRSEIAILRLLRHQHVIYLKDVIDMKDSLCIVMELVRGGELYDLVHSEHRLSEAHAHKIILQLLQTVAYLHKCGIVHRDIKPENLLLTDRTEWAAIKLTDFGLSTLCGPNELLTQPCGTLAYLAPEVLTMQGYNQKADVWSVGVIMYLLIRGRLPFSVKKVFSRQIWDHYKLSFDCPVWQNVSSSAKDLMTKLLEIDPSKRISVFEALDHIWVKNFVAVTRDACCAFGENGDTSTAANDLINSLRNTTDTTFIIPYTETCISNLEALRSDCDDSSNTAKDKKNSDKEEKSQLSARVLDTVRE